MTTQKILVSIAHQKLTFFSGKKYKEYSVSTALKGVGQEKGSFCTPLGRHYVRAKVGAGQPEGAVFVGRRPTGEIYSSALNEQYPDRDWILTRILWLSGKEQGFNRLGSVDSMQRYIYIHGTPDTEPMGVPRSHGCVRMRNADVIELFEQVDPGCEVDVQES